MKKLAQIVVWLAWVTAAFFAGQFLAAAIFHLLPFSFSSDDTLALALAEALAYGLMLAIGVGVPALLRRKIKLPGFREIVALTRRIKWRDLGLALWLTLGYYLILIVVMLVLMVFLPGIMSEEQAVGFSKIGNAPWQLVLIFLAVAVVAPLAEELLMRGLLFGRLRARLPFLAAALLVSLLFALAHGQLNVAVDTFILSMMMCYAREKTGALYAPIIIHVAKNSVAFCILFLS
ncbi:MAG: CPBP family intramembrane metalloprotease [Candidatus Nomurabacteria bacterium]|jgi:membrane protease YdiL (CAAX protease family)|nr:CPBP family intramembrane metalloprotease [Candidatus Nomurabacteria bacterium]